MGLEEQVRRVADELEIRNLLARLAQTADDGDLNEYVQLFTEDGSWQGPPGHPQRRGRADILAGAKERRASGTQGPGTNTFHVVTNIAINVDGDKATGKAYYHFYENTQDTPVLSRMGVYHDEFRRTPHGWKLARRVAIAAGT